jgi:Flp pilus assembly protein TadG
MIRLFTFDALREKLKAFGASRNGNVALIFGLALIPVFGIAGAAVDYSRANSAKSSMQGALDATALQLSKNAAGLTAAQLQQSATGIFTAQFNRPGMQNVAVTATFNSTTSTVTVSASAAVPSTILGIMGINQLDIGTSTTVTWGNTRLRVALVLDNTGSMADASKMDALKTATQNLLTQLQSAAVNSSDVYVSIIPFGKDVNVDPANYAQNWIRWDLWEEVNGTCSKKPAKFPTQTACTGAGHTWTPADHSTWNGCVTDRDQNNDTNNVAPSSGVSSTLYPAEQYSSCAVTLMGLSNDWPTLSSKVSAMQPNGNTNQAIGLQMGWQSLTAAPFTVPAMDPRYQYQQVIILLTDGLNTQDRWYTDQSSIDRRQQITCDNINAANITLYAVQVDTGGDPTSTLLQNCAGSPGKYPDSGKFFLLTTSDQIVSTFQQIGTAISQLRISR